MDPIGSIGAASSSLIVEQASGPSMNLSAVAEKFARMMKESPPLSSVEAESPSTLGKMLINQDESIRKEMQDTAALMQAAIQQPPGVDLTAYQVTLMYQFAGTHFQVQAMSSLAQTAKTGLQTLMRNQ
ncbi:type III secretion protein [Acidovorax sp. NCPPB 3576]|uniref:type III secretion protein n=1 Tax=Acidovorax sp. NCPPB 3576 TaxID=2940488 RepID=UPI00234B54C0|nr:type III secretion protein [Acidovorax sp. NCPPB 3576]WCM87890.1 type III secretion protein [Acidovorax sp. NCPPB 3576]